VLIPDAVPAPAWVDSGAEPIRGLDLLGLRLPAQVLGNALLTGVTTITPTVRYLSVHAWLAHAYAQARRPDNWSEYRAFAASAEAALVLGNLLVAPEAVGLIGSDKGTEVLASAADPVPLGELVKQLAVSIYANPALQLGVTFARDSGVPGLTKERGVPLAESVKKRVEETALGEHLSRGRPLGEASRTHLAEFGGAVLMGEVPAPERQLLLAALLPEAPHDRDIPRMATCAVLMSLARQLGRAPEEADVFSAAREPVGSLPPELNAILDGWLRYSVRDLLAATGEAAFKVVVSTLGALAGSDRRAVPAASVIGELLSDEADHRETLIELALARRGEALWSLSFNELHTRVADQLGLPKSSSGGLARWTGPINEWNVMEAALDLGPPALTLLPVAWSLAVLRADPWKAEEHGPFEVRGDVGWNRLGLDEIIRPTVARFRSNRTSLHDATAELAARMIDQHLRVAWARMSDDMRHDVAALTTDGQEWIPRGKTVSADRAASRLPQITGWLRQLGLIDLAGITDEGDVVLTRTLGSLREGRCEPA
jgi:hypothetical protein